MLIVIICILWRYRNRHGIYFCDDMRIVINVFHSMTFLRKTSLVTFCDGRSMTILVTQRKCHHCNSVTKNHVFSDDNRSSWIVKSLVVNGQLLWFSKATIQLGSSRSSVGFMFFHTPNNDRIAHEPWTWWRQIGLELSSLTMSIIFEFNFSKVVNKMYQNSNATLHA